MRKTVVVVFCAALSAACGHSPVAPPSVTLDEALPVKVETPHYVFHMSSGDTVESARAEAWHQWALAQLALAPDRTIQYNKYRNREQLRQVTGKDANGWADPPAFAVHVIFPWDPHEVVHVLTSLIGHPSEFFNEGIAVAMTVDPAANQYIPRWNGQSVHAWARSFRSSGQLPRLSDVVESEQFRRLSDTTSYPIAGSLVSFLIDTRGMAAMRRFFAGGNRDESRAAIDQKFTEAFGVDIEEAERAWHAFLDGGQERP